MSNIFYFMSLYQNNIIQQNVPNIRPIIPLPQVFNRQNFPITNNDILQNNFRPVIPIVPKITIPQLESVTSQSLTQPIIPQPPIIPQSIISPRQISIPTISQPRIQRIPIQVLAPTQIPISKTPKSLKSDSGLGPKGLLLQSVVQQPIINNEIPINEDICDESNDKMGYGILSTFDNKYRLADRTFDRERNRIKNLYSNHKITKNGYDVLTNIIDLYQERYDKFMKDVTENRTFVEKASSGKPQRDIKTSQDWGEAIIELVNLIDIFKRDLETFLDIETSKTTIDKECRANPIDSCQLPCAIKKPFFRRQYCALK